MRSDGVQPTLRSVGYNATFWNMPTEYNSKLAQQLSLVCSIKEKTLLHLLLEEANPTKSLRDSSVKNARTALITRHISFQKDRECDAERS